MPHRDPETGKFVSDRDLERFDDIEVATFRGHASVASGAISSNVSNPGDFHSYAGVRLVDYDQLVDRNEELVLLTAEHRLSVIIGGSALSTPSTQYGSAMVTAEVSASPSLSTAATQGRPGTGNTRTVSGGPVLGQGNLDDSIDVIGRPLATKATQDFSDTPTGAGGAGSSSDDTMVLGRAPAEFGRFHPRDELFMNGIFRLYNMDNAGITANVYCQHVYGVIEG